MSIDRSISHFIFIQEKKIIQIKKSFKHIEKKKKIPKCFIKPQGIQDSNKKKKKNHKR